MVSQIPYSTTPFKDTHFETSSKSEVDTDKSSKKEDIDVSDIYSTNEKSDKELSGQDF